MRAISDWKAGCGKSARPVWWEGQGVKSLSLPQYDASCSVWKGLLGTGLLLHNDYRFPAETCRSPLVFRPVVQGTGGGQIVSADWIANSTTAQFTGGEWDGRLWWLS